ncbi:BREX-1 system adenine-specific DNA-methyltransferase PglX [Myxococcota bacterium]|nr:BREX-1 system adenine-specific DNA-methyltransferase PglX [Myxococcota bacterium]
MDKDTRNRIQRATQAARRLLEGEIAAQLEGTFDIRPDGTVAEEAGRHLDEDPAARRVRRRLVDAVAHHRAQGRTAPEAVAALTRECAFTTLNRFVALKMLEARGIVRESVRGALASSGFREFQGLAEGLKVRPHEAYRLYLECLFDEVGREVRVLFDRRDPASLLWPRRNALEDLLGVLNDPELAQVWGEDETIGWVYQYFNGEDERRRMRAESQAPRDSRELAVRNQFFTPRYVVEFLTDNTLGQTWLEMRRGGTRLAELCRYLVRRPGTVFLAEGEAAPEPDETVPPEQRPVHLPFRAKKDPRDLKILDPACGSGHFLLYAFDLLLVIYEEAWEDEGSPASEATGRSLREDYATREALRRELPGLVLRHNLYGVDIDPRAAQIAALALWMRAQRAWKDLGLDRAKRPLVTRTNVVIAEPMPGEADLLDEFCWGLDPDVAALVRRVFEEMRLAGEAGTLLRIEDTVRQELEKRFSRGPMYARLDRERWEEVEGKVYEALREYAEGATTGNAYRRRLFAEDAARGFAFIDVCRGRYDVVLMNPPFGRLPDSPFLLLRRNRSLSYVEASAALVDRAAELTNGPIGVVAPNSVLTTKRLGRWRRHKFNDRFAILVDAGMGLMDDAVVRACYFVLAGAPGSAEDSVFVVSGEPGQSAEALLAASAGRPRDPAWRARRQIVMSVAHQVLTGGALASTQIGEQSESFEPAAGTARQGPLTHDDERFLRIWTEVNARDLSPKCWARYAKGGEFQPFYGDVHLVLNRRQDGAELDAVNMAINGQTAQCRTGSSWWYRGGATYSYRSTLGFAVRNLPRGVIMSIVGPAVISITESVSNAYLVGWLNAAVTRKAVMSRSTASAFPTGLVKSLNWRWPQEEVKKRVEHASMIAISAARALRGLDELDPTFGGMPAHIYGTGVGRGLVADEHCRRKVELHKFNEALAVIDDEIAQLFGVTASDDVRKLSTAWSPEFGAAEVVMPVVSALVGTAYGRFDIRLATGERPLPPEPDPFDPLPPCSPGMLTGEDGLPADAPPAGYPIAFPTDGILVDDPGHERDLLGCIRRVFDVVFGDDGDERLREATALLDPGADDLRPWLRRAFFAEHVQRYSRSRRKAPIYWRLGTPSGSYSVWVYIHRFARDTLHRVLHDHVAPKLRFEEGRLAHLRAEVGGTPTPSQRRALAEQEAFVDELRAFRDEVARVAPLWDPDLDDGVILNAAPLHRLFAHTRSWQKECEGAFARLCEAEYDWSHLAMRLWPERVVPKCALDRSLAIAHGLEDVFWCPDEDGRWSPREVEGDVVESLVRERTSPAVKDALAKLTHTPPPAPARRSPGRPARAAPERPRRGQERSHQLDLALPKAPPAEDS